MNLSNFRTLLNFKRLIILAAAFLTVQLGVVSHPLHRDVATSGSVCAFCFVGTHLVSAPQVPVVHIKNELPLPVDQVVRHVHIPGFAHTPRLTCGPPAFNA